MQYSGESIWNSCIEVCNQLVDHVLCDVHVGAPLHFITDVIVSVSGPFLHLNVYYEVKCPVVLCRDLKAIGNKVVLDVSDVIAVV